MVRRRATTAALVLLDAFDERVMPPCSATARRLRRAVAT
jgi:hypothetical protein